MKLKIPAALLRPAFRLNGQLRNIRAPAWKGAGDVEIEPFLGGAACAASISADFELAWAWRNLSREGMERRARIERENVPRLVRMLEDLRIPITWATVGHLFLDGCRHGPDGRAHGEMPRPRCNFGWDGDWFAHDPGVDAREAPGWFCPDLIRGIQESDVGHEIGTHSFSHIDFSPEGSDAALVRREIEACVSAMEPFGVAPRSLVYCFNKMGHQHLPLLASLGLTCVRHRDPTCRLAYPERVEPGIYKIYESMNLRLASRYDYAAKAGAFLEEARAKRAAYHLWFHPSDSWEVFDGAFEPILRIMAEMRRRGELWIATMRDLVSYAEARHCTELGVSKKAGTVEISLRCGIETARFGTPAITLAANVERTPSGVNVVGEDGSRRMVGFRTVVRGGRTRISLEVPCGARGVELLGQ